MEITRIYKNGTDTLRVDTLSTFPIFNHGKIATYKADNGPTFRQSPRKLNTQVLRLTGETRTIDGIEVIGNFDDIETSSGDYLWVTKTLGNDQVIRINMTDLPGIGDTV